MFDAIETLGSTSAHGKNQRLLNAAVLVCSIVLAIILALIFLGAETAGESDLRMAVAAELPRSGVENPVTAVLLNFRAYDTLLEVAVLFVIAVTLLPAVPPRRRASFSFDPAHSSEHLLSSLFSWAVPFAVLIAGYLLWTGAYSPGGAFQAAAVLAAAGIMLVLKSTGIYLSSGIAVRIMLALGLTAFLGIGWISVLEGGLFLQYPVNRAGAMILLIESALTLSIAATLLMFSQRLMNKEPGDSGGGQ